MILLECITSSTNYFDDGADFDEEICSQISPADPSLVDKKAFDVTCSADRTEAICSFEPSAKQSLPSDDLSKQIACLLTSVLVVFILLSWTLLLIC